jgi:hypothetical protein
MPVAAGPARERLALVSVSSLLVLSYVRLSIGLLLRCRRGEAVSRVFLRAAPSGMLCSVALLASSADHRAMFDIYSPPVAILLFCIALQATWVQAMNFLLSQTSVAELVIRQAPSQVALRLRGALRVNKVASVGCFLAQLVASCWWCVKLSGHTEGHVMADWALCFGACVLAYFVNFSWTAHVIIGALDAVIDPISRESVCGRLVRLRALIGMCAAAALALVAHTAAVDFGSENPARWFSAAPWHPFGAAYTWLVALTCGVLYFFSRPPQCVAPSASIIGPGGPSRRRRPSTLAAATPLVALASVRLAGSKAHTRSTTPAFQPVVVATGNASPEGPEPPSQASEQAEP